MTAMPLTVVVPTHDRRDILSETIQSILNQGVDSDHYEVVVVVDGSSDGTVEMLEGLGAGPRLRVVKQKNRGLAAARNRGVAEARGRVILFLDDDMIASQDLVAVHLDEHAPPGERVVFGALALAPGVRRSFLKQGVEEWGNDVNRRLAYPGYRFRFDDCHFGHASVTRSLLQRVAGFDETFVRFGNEDYELGWRLIQSRVKMQFASRAVASQIYEKTFRRWQQDSYCVGLADVALGDKHPSLAAELRHYLPVRHPIKRLVRYLSQLPVDPLTPAWGVTAVVMEGLERWGARGAALSRVQSLLGERWYWRGVRDARRRRPGIEAGDPSWPEKLA